MSKKMIETRRITQLVVWFFYIYIACSVLYLVSALMLNAFISSIEQGTYLYGYESMMADAEAHDLRDSIISGLIFIVYILCAISFLRWTYKSSQITHLSGAQDLRFSPGWSVGWYFIPIAVLWKPFQAFKQIYQVSIQINNWKNVVIPSSLRWWWGLFILSNFINNILFRLYLDTWFQSELDGSGSLSDYDLIFFVEFVCSSLEIVCCLILIKILKGISYRYNSNEFQAILSGKPPEESSSEEHTEQESTRENSLDESSTEETSKDASDLYFDNRKRK